MTLIGLEVCSFALRKSYCGDVCRNRDYSLNNSKRISFPMVTDNDVATRLEKLREFGVGRRLGPYAQR